MGARQTSGAALGLYLDLLYVPSIKDTIVISYNLILLEQLNNIKQTNIFDNKKYWEQLYQ